MITASRVFGDQVGSTAPAFLAILAVHVLAGLAAVISGAIAAVTRKGSPRHVKAGRRYYLAIGVVFASAAGLAAMRWAQDYYLLIIGAVAFGAATVGYLHRRLRRPGDAGHIAGMGIAYTAMLTAFYVDNGPHLPLWDRLPTLSFWFLPSAIAAPIIIRALRRASRARPHRPCFRRPASRDKSRFWFTANPDGEEAAVADSVVDDLVAEEVRLDSILSLLTEGQWLTDSAADGWSVADVVLHLAQGDEGVVASAGGASPRAGAAGAGTVDEWAARMVEAERAAPAEVFLRWRRSRDAAVAALRAADPQTPLQWVAGPVKPATLATTRLAEYWAHGLDITGPFRIDFPDTSRLRHIAWLAHRTLPYAMSLAGETPAAVRCSLTAPDGVTTWTFGPDDAESEISGPAGAFCRVAAQRLDPAASGLRATGPHGAAALRVVRTYA